MTANLYSCYYGQTNVLFWRLSHGDSHSNRTNAEEVAAIGAACSFLHAAFNTLPLERIMTVLAYRTELVPFLWNFMKRCHDSENWSSLSQLPEHLRGEAPGWLLPLAVFCPIYKYGKSSPHLVCLAHLIFSGYQMPYGCPGIC